nr:ORF2a protein [Betaarterivirus suid 1]WAL36883.1 ORF2a protein [Betaarterivirus suid 1]WAL36903.1 ORF2a protein [Betaarterivirus suid 1]WAL36913.1 ORF2a protein [Betaarterivirus suid 1]WAL36923.1 ORF2a protein [Betaarterivirus suid 1]
MQWGHCGAKSASCSWTLSLSSSLAWLTLSFSLPYCLGSQSPDGYWSFFSEWFAPRFSVRALPFTLPNYRRSYEGLLPNCRPDVPQFAFKHPLGMFWHVRVSHLIDEMVSRRIYQTMEHSGQAAWKQVVAEATLTKLSRLDIVTHFQHLAAVEADSCRFLSSRLVMLKNLAVGNVSLQYNTTLNRVELVFPTLGSRPKLIDFRQWLVSVHASIFSSVASSVTLFIVLWLRIPALRYVFGFHWPTATHHSS